jgi:hypothetical protein
MTGLVLFPRHVRAASLCMAGARSWATAHGVEWGRFVKDGLLVDEMPHDWKQDPLMARAIEAARKEQRNG